MDAIFVPVLDLMDGVRGRLLRFGLSFHPLRRVFVNRAWRLLALFFLSIASALCFSSLFPLWVLLLGPIVYGIPHLLSSLRFAQRAVSNDERGPRFETFRFFTMVWIGVMALRLAMDRELISAPEFFVYSNFPEWIASGATLVGAWYFYGRTRVEFFFSVVLLAPLVLASWYAPGETIGGLILLHNVVAFVFWIRSANASKADRRVAITSLFVFVLANVAIFSGVFDRWLVSATDSIMNGALTISDLGSFIAPWTENEMLKLHCVVAYAFGQSVHYFIWLKAIPDQVHVREVPTTFRQSYSIARRELGRFAIAFALVGCVVGVAYWAFIEYSVARGVYFSVAAYHGYLELGVLSLALVAREGSKRV